MPNKYRVGVIGHTGKGNYGHGLDTVWLHMPNCEIAGVADAHEGGLKAAVERLKALAGYSDYREMLDKEKLDIVAIGPRWLDQHRDMVVAAAERGVHIYMEKPMCRTLEEADQMVAACEKNQIKFAIAYQTRYSPLIQTIRDMIYDDKLGRILELRGRGKDDRRGGGEDLWVLGSHIMNLMHTFGGEPEWCFATVKQDGHPVTKADVRAGNEGIGPLAGDSISAMYQMSDGANAYFGTEKNANDGGRKFALNIFGTKGILEIVTGYLPSVGFLPDPNWSPRRSGKSWLPVSSAGIGKPEPLTDAKHLGGNIAACRDLISAIEEDRQPEASVYEARTSTEMIVAVFESQRQGGPVKMPLKNRKNPLEML